MRLTDCTSAGGSPPRPGAAEAPAAPRASSSTARDTSGERAEAGATSVIRNAAPGEEEQDHRKDPGFARPITLATTSSSRVGVLCEYFARFSFSRLGGGGLEDGGGHVGLGLGGRGGRFGIGLGGGLALVGDGGAEDGVGVGRAAHDNIDVNIYDNYIIYMDVLNEVSVMPARGAQSC